MHRQGSLTSAGEVLCLSQSALSHAIKKLEQNAGADIWYRDGHKLRLTQAGKYLLKLANNVLPQLDEADSQLKQYGEGWCGSLRIGMECYPCYQWLLRLISPYFLQWPNVDVDVKQSFQFDGVTALLSHEIDLLITPDPIFKANLHFESVYSYEQVIVMSKHHPLAGNIGIKPSQLVDETLITYPVELDRLDIYTQFLNPCGIALRKIKTVESTEIMLQMVECDRGIASLPLWLIQQYSKKLNLVSVRAGNKGIHKNIYIGVRNEDIELEYINSFILSARTVNFESSAD